MRSPITGPIGFSVSNRTDSFAMTLAQAAVLAPRWLRDGLGALELGFFAPQFDEPRQPLTSDAARLAQEGMHRIADSGIAIWSVHLPFGLQYDLSSPDEAVRTGTVELYKRWMETAALGGAGVAVVHPSAEPIADEDRGAHLEQCRRSLEELTAQAPVKLAVECLPRSCLCNRAEEALALLEGTKAGLCMDVNHPHREPPAEFIRRLAHHIVSVHISDDDGIDEKHWLPGRGVIDWADVMEALSGAEYTGAFIYELAPPSGLDSAGIDFALNYRYLTERWHAKYAR